MPRQTTMAKTTDVFPHRWLHVDADGKVLGRMATRIATALMGKHRPQYTPNVDTGDFVVVTNASKVVLTGKKAEQKMRKTFVYYPDGLKMKPYGEVLAERPEVIVEEAVKRMLPKGRLGRKMLTKLKVYAGAEHPHQAQQPEPLSM